MAPFTIVDIAIGIVFVYLMLSLICSVINEAIAAMFKSRASNLKTAIDSLFSGGMGKNGKKLVDEVYDHGLIQSLYEKSKGLPSYIPSRIFAEAVVNILGAGSNRAVHALSKEVSALPKSKGSEALAALIAAAGTDVEKAKQNIEDWFNDGMDRAAGWYKRQTQKVLFLVAVVIAITLNADTFQLFHSLWTQPSVRAATTAAADRYVREHSLGKRTAIAPGPGRSKSSVATSDERSTTPEKESDTQRTFDAKELESSLTEIENAIPNDLHLGWPARITYSAVIENVHWYSPLGWLLTALALTLGAPFWFDVLNKFMVVRSTIKPKEKSQVERSKD